MATPAVRTTFPYPIGILLFNNPSYSRAVIESLLAQTLAIDISRIVVHLDAFPGSKDEFRFWPDRTASVAEVVGELLPGAHVITATSNRGIAMAFETVENAVYSLEESEWALFLEHDLVLGERYLEAIEQLVSLVADTPEIAQVNATGDTHIPRHQGEAALYTAGHAWGFALRKSHAIERRDLMQHYYASIAGGSYFQRDRQRVFTAMASVGIFLQGMSQDRVKWAIMRRMGRLHLTTGRHYGQYIGERGEHYGARLYQKHGYGAWEVSDADPNDIHLERCADLPRFFHEEVQSTLDMLGSSERAFLELRSEQRSWAGLVHIAGLLVLRNVASTPIAKAAARVRRRMRSRSDR